MEIFTRLGTLEHTGHCFPVIVSRYGEEAFEISNSYIRVIIPFNKEVLLNYGAISGKKITILLESNWKWILFAILDMKGFTSNQH